jgi:hypothetical protein
MKKKNKTIKKPSILQINRKEIMENIILFISQKISFKK